MEVQEQRDWWPPGWPDWPENLEARKVVAGLFEVGMFIINAPASRRESRMEQAKDRARHNFELLSSNTRHDADALVNVSQANALIMSSIRWQRNKAGLGSVKHLRPQWYTADFKMKKAKEEVTLLGVPAYEYFMSCMEQFYISQEEKDDEGSYHGFPDYSELRRQWYARETITVPLPWAWDYMLQICKRYAPTEKSAKRDSADIASVVRNNIWNMISIILGAAGLALTLWFGLGGI